ncbi:hypothetical protein BRPE64_ACDS04640 [Caballeronia insecticola]|uniref:Uncharacterized protein n=1 Tax=Caballeronia insecticola TaxID=758793 RepID=R4WF72_9BURK|nr:hypothetical protein BRPE64_ACDS04640 [Caballeronia insecticola]
MKYRGHGPALEKRAQHAMYYSTSTATYVVNARSTNNAPRQDRSD